MRHNCVQRCSILLGLALSLGLMLTTGWLAGIALAQGPGGGQPPTDSAVQTYWLVLDSRLPVSETLPSLLKDLAMLRDAGEVFAFDQTPQSSSPVAVSALQVTAPLEALNRLRHLPGVLDASDGLPPPPRAAGDIGILATTGSIAGRVTDAETGAGIEEIYLNIYDAVSYEGVTDLVSTDAEGYYTATASAPYAKVKIQFVGGDSYASEWYENQDSFSSATAVDLIAGGTVQNINASLEQLGTVRGTVRFDGSGAPVSNIEVRFCAPDGSHCRDGIYNTDGDGQYSRNLPGGTYKIRFSGNPLITEWYQDKSSLIDSDPVVVNPGQTTIVDADVTSAGWVTGTVVNADTGLPIQYVWVKAYDPSGNLVSASAGSDGSYSIGGLATGDYRLSFTGWDDEPWAPYYTPKFYDDKPTIDQATPVSVIQGLATPNIDAALSRPPFGPTPPGTLAATITKDGGQPLTPDEAVSLEFFDITSGEYTYGATLIGEEPPTAEYIRADIPSGTYKIKLISKQLGLEWYNHKDLRVNADVITITVDQTTTISIDLPSATGCISGTVTAAADGAQLGNISVKLFPGPENWYEGDYDADTDENGIYQFCQLRGASYLIRFCGSPYACQWHVGKLSIAEADSISVSNGVTVTVDAALDMGGCLAGKVVDKDGTVRPLDWISLDGTLARPNEQMTDDHGEYNICELPAGTYVVQCADEESGLNGSVWADVTSGQATTGVICTPGFNPIPVSGVKIIPSPWITVSVGSGAFTETVNSIYTSEPITPTGSLTNVGLFYDLNIVYSSTNQPASLQEGQYYTLTVTYRPELVPSTISETDLAIYYWDGSQWVREPTSVVNVISHTITAWPTHFSQWAALGEPGAHAAPLYLPIILKIK
jgi:hypothetical protein